MNYWDLVHCVSEREKLEERDSIVKTLSESNVMVQPMYVDLTSSCPVKRSENRHFVRHLMQSVIVFERPSGPKGSKATHPVLVYVDARPRTYLDEAKSHPYTIIVWKSVRLLLSSELT